jgi:hypothetical protein
VNTNTTGRRRRYSARAGAIATIAAVIFGAAACGTETSSDDGQPAAPAARTPQATPQATHAPTSADAAERQAEADRMEQYGRHYGGDQHRD